MSRSATAAWLLASSLLLGVLVWLGASGGGSVPATVPGTPSPTPWALADGSLAGRAPDPDPEAETGLAEVRTPALGADCGWSAWLSAPAAGSDARVGAPPVAEQLRQTRSLAQALSVRLQASGDLRSEAVGGWLASVPLALGDASLMACEGAACQTAMRNTLRQMERHADVREAARRSVVERALSSSDPAVVALGLHACEQGADDQDCVPALATLWSTLEPDNAAAWLALARTAGARGDRVAEAQAMHNASMALRFQPLSHWLLADVVKAMPPELRGAPRLTLLVAVTEAVDGIATPLGSALSYCREASQASSGRRQTCTALAELLLGQARDMTDLLFALSLARQVGLQEGRLTALQAELESLRGRVAALQAGADSGVTGASQGCRGVQALNNFLQRRARLGELAALRSLPG